MDLIKFMDLSILDLNNDKLNVINWTILDIIPIYM